MVLLEYNPDGDDEPYHDRAGNHIYWPGEHDVPADAVARLLDADEWGRAATPGGNSFDVETFLENEWNYIVGEIEAGAVDDHLEDIRAKEKSREAGSGPRDSVLNAVEDRLDELTGNSDDDGTSPRDVEVDVVSGGAPEGDDA